MHCPGGNATDLIWRVLASSGEISSWTPLSPQHSNHKRNPNPFAYQLWCIDFLTLPTPIIDTHRLLAFLESLMPLKNWCSIHATCSKSRVKYSIRSVAFFPSLKQNFIAYRSSSCPECIFEIHPLWQSGFSRVYSNSCCSCSFEAEIIIICQSSHKMYSNNILNFQGSTTFLMPEPKSLENYWIPHVCVCVCVCVVKDNLRAPFSMATTYIYIRITPTYIFYISKVGERSRRRPEGSFFNSYYTNA